MPLAQEERLKPVLYDEEPSDELLEWARNHINEDPDSKDQLISELRDMIYGKNPKTFQTPINGLLYQSLNYSK